MLLSNVLRRKDCFAGYLIWCIPLIILFVVGSLIFQAPPRVVVHTEDAPTLAPKNSPTVAPSSIPSVELWVISPPITAAPMTSPPSFISGSPTLRAPTGTPTTRRLIVKTGKND